MRVKNITSHADSSGSSEVIAQPGDSIRFLVAIRNADTYDHTYTITPTLPLLMAQTSSFQEYREDAWRPLAGSVSTAVHLFPLETRFIRFEARIAASFPNENRVMTITSAIDDGAGGQAVRATKVYVPYFTETSLVPPEYDVLPAETAKQLLQEERTLIEQKFSEMLTAPPAPTPASAATPTQTSSFSLFFAVLLGGGSILILLFSLFHALRRP